MSTDTDTMEAFEADLAARMGAATESVTADGVTREGIDERIAARRNARRFRQSGLMVAAAALVVALGVGAVLAASGEPDTDVKAGNDGQTTEAPSTTEEPTTTDGPTSTTGTTEAPTTPPPATEPPATTAPPATEPPATTAPPATDPPTTTTPVLTPGQPCTPGSSPDCIDPEGDGSSVYLIGGAACMAQPTDDAMCADLDGDGTAGYPDSEGQSYQPDLDGDGQPGYPDSEGQQPDLDGDGLPGYPDSQ